MTHRHPLDFDSLQKGDTISETTLEEILGISVEDRLFSLARLQLQERISVALRDRGCPVTVATRKGALVVLTDQEAAEYNPKLFTSYFRRLTRSHRRLLEVDFTNLSEAEKDKAERAILMQAKMIGAAKTARQIALSPVERTTPRLNPGKTR